MNINKKFEYLLDENFQDIKHLAQESLSEYIGEGKAISFDENSRSVTFSSELLVPEFFHNKPTVILLFSNPHPHSIEQGMFLSPSKKNTKNPFWTAMKDAGWFQLNTHEPKEQRKKLLTNDYAGPFNLIFYCYYDFPTKDPDHIREIFGDNCWNKLKMLARKKLLKFVEQNHIDAILAFNGKVYRSIGSTPVKAYTKTLNKKELVVTKLNNAHKNIPVYVTYPTGWHFHKDIKELRNHNLTKIRMEIDNEGSDMENSVAASSEMLNINLPYENISFHISTLINHLADVGRKHIIIGGNFCVYNLHKKPNSLDYWIRKNVSKTPDTCNAVGVLVEQLVNTRLFKEGKFSCPDSGAKCKGIKLVNANIS